MHNHVAQVLGLFDDAHAELQTATESVPEPLRSRRPSETRWSVNDVLEHLSLVETRVSGVLREAIAAARQRGLGPEGSERAALSSETSRMLVDRSHPRTAPEAVQPTGRLTSQDAWAAVERSRDAIRKTLLGAEGLALGQITHAHPLFGELTAYQWVEALSGHRRRHAAQIREAATELMQM
jgi:hypothetical protein